MIFSLNWVEFIPMRVCFFLLLLLLKPFHQFSQEVYLVKDHEPTYGIMIGNNSNALTVLDDSKAIWKYKAGDDIQWVSDSLDDHPWDTIHHPALLPESFNGTACFRIHFKLPLQLIGKSGISISHKGASEIYLDGKLLEKFGEVSSNPEKEIRFTSKGESILLPVNDTAVHLLAIRYSNTAWKRYAKNYLDNFQGPQIQFIDFVAAGIIKSNQDILQFSVFSFLSGIFIALALVHLLMYYFERRQKFNLYQSLFVGILGILSLLPMVYLYSEDPDFSYPIQYFADILVPVFLLSLTSLTRSLFNVKEKGFYYTVIVFFAATVLTKLVLPAQFGLVNGLMFLVVYIGATVGAIKGLRNNWRGAKFVGLGILSFTGCIILLIVVVIIAAIVGKGTLSDFIGIIVIVLMFTGMMATPLSVSAFLAYEFAAQSKLLVKQIEQIERLSEQTIQQEIEKKLILEKQNEILEHQVTERTLEITEKNTQLEHQKKEITDSISYAKRIQQALLPTADEIKEVLPETFVLYFPKDIVSGDFYYFKKINQSSAWIAAVDCTGHGVPGALMSMIGSKELNLATDQAELPGTALNLLNAGVKNSLKQTHADSTRDGMDLALLKIEKSHVCYSGANRPLWIIRNNAEVIEEIKPTKCSIGGLTSFDQSFQNHEVGMQAGDMVYIFSDGYADQFGGKKIKKLTTKKFKEFLLTIHHKEISQQHLYLAEFFHEWKGETEQVDDILVIGIKF